jgi:gluconokinase
VAPGWQRSRRNTLSARSSVRATVYDRTGQEVEGTEGRVPWRWRLVPGGGVEADPDALLDAAFHAIDRALAGAGTAAAEVRAVGISTFWHGIMGLASDGRPLTPLYSWADARSAAAARALRRQLDEDAVRQRTGCVFHPSYPAARLAWLRDAAPDAYRRVRRWVGIGEYLALRCFGRAVCSISMASGTGLLDQRRCEWDAEMLGILGLTPDHLGPLGDLDAPLAGLARPFASRWPALAAIPWLPAAGDGALSNVGAGCVGPARAALTVGTTGALRVLRRGPVPAVPRGLWVYRLDRARVLTGGAVSNGGNVYRWVQERMALGPPDAVEEALRRRPPAAHGLVVLPFLAGERSPAWPLCARGAIVGMTLATEPLDLLQAALEAVAYRIGLVWTLLRGAVPEAREIVASGGALHHSPAWTQIFADALGHEIVASAEPEASSRGAALVALEALGAGRLEEMPVPPGSVFRPDPERHARHREASARQQRVEEALRPLEAAFGPDG